MTAEHVLAADPGETSGLAWCELSVILGVEGSPLSGAGKRDERYARLFEWGEIKGDIGKQAKLMAKGIRELQARVLVTEVSDHFLQQKRAYALTHSSLVPIKLVGAYTALVALQNWQGSKSMVLVEQTPSQAKKVMTDKVLRAYGFPVGKRAAKAVGLDPMSPHEADAVRHLLLFIRRMYGSSGTGGGFAQVIAEDLR